MDNYKLFKTGFRLILIINFIFYIFLPAIFLFTPIPFWVSKSSFSITDFYLGPFLAFFIMFGVPILLLMSIIFLFFKPSKEYLLWLCVLLNITTLILFHIFFYTKITDYIRLSIKNLIEPKIAETTNQPNDFQWASSNTLFRWGQEFIKLPEAWDIETGKTTVKIGVIDTGVDLKHEDLKDNINPDSITKVIDIHIHGTHVAGIIGAKGYNATGIAGVMWNASLLSYDVKIPWEGNQIFLPDAIGTMKKAIENGAKIINLSAGDTYKLKLTTDLFNEIWKYFILNRPQYQNIIFVFNAGNENVDVKYTSPASLSSEYDNVISVAASDENGNLAVPFPTEPGSNWGEVSVAAPGTQIYSTIPNNDYGFGWGISFSAPFVSGLAGLIYSVDPSKYEGKYKGKILTAKDVKELIVEGAINGGKFVSGPDDNQIPIINAYESLKLLITPPPPGPQPGPNIGDYISLPMLSGHISGIAAGDSDVVIGGLAIMDGNGNVLIAEGSGELSKVDLNTGKVTTIAFVSPGGIASPVIEPSGNSVVVVANPGAGGGASGLKRVNLVTGQATTIIGSGIDRGAAMALMPHGKSVLATGAEGGLYQVNLETGAISVISGVGGLGLAIESGGTTALVATGIFGAGVYSCDLVRINLQTGDLNTIAKIDCVNRPTGVAIEPGGETALVITSGEFGQIFRVNLSSGLALPISSCVACTWPQIAIEPDGNTALFLGNYGQTIIRFDRTAFTQTPLVHSDMPKGAALSSDNITAYTVAEYGAFGGRLSRVNLLTGKVDPLVFTEMMQGGIDLDKDERNVFVTSVSLREAHLQKIDLTTKIASIIASSPLGMSGLVLENSGNTALAASTGGGSLFRIDLTSGAVNVISDQLLGPVAVAIEKEGVSSLVAEERNNVSLSRVDLKTGAITRIAENLKAIGGAGGAIGGIALEPGTQNTLVVIGGSLLRINLINGAGEELVSQICGLVNDLSGVIVETGANTALLSHNVCGILRVRIR
jgi:sugar lactone lactonase YvrE